MTYRCDVCGKHLYVGGSQMKVGYKEYCGPDGSPCHIMGIRNRKWTLTEAEAVAMFNDFFGEAAS